MVSNDECSCSQYRRVPMMTRGIGLVHLCVCFESVGRGCCMTQLFREGEAGAYTGF